MTKVESVETVRVAAVGDVVVVVLVHFRHLIQRFNVSSPQLNRLKETFLGLELREWLTLFLTVLVFCHELLRGEQSPLLVHQEVLWWQTWRHAETHIKVSEKYFS